MGRPDRLRIPHDPDPEGRFHHVGRTPDGRQFLAFVTGAFEYDPVAATQRWDGEKKWLAVVHIFAPDGAHLGTETRLGGFDHEGRLLAGSKAWDELGDLLAEVGLAGCLPGDINVAPFELVRDGVLYGLIYESYGDDGEEHELVMLEPNDVMFHPPWDSGQFST